MANRQDNHVVETLYDIMEFFDPSPIYNNMSGVIDFYLTWVIWVVLALAIGLRFSEEQFKNMGGKMNIMAAAGDITKSFVMLGVYIGFGLLVVDFIASLSALAYKHGSFKAIVAIYADNIATLNTRINNEDNAWYENLSNTLGVISYDMVAWLLFYLSFLALTFIYVMIRIAYAILFVVIYVYGLLSVSSISSKTINLQGGFTKSVIGLVLWPLIEATMFMLAIPLFEGWSARIAEYGGSNADAAFDLAGLYILYFFANLVLLFVTLSSGVITYFLSTNQSALMGAIMPAAAIGLGGFQLFRSVTEKMGMPIGNAFPNAQSKILGMPNKLNVGMGNVLSGAAGLMGHGIIHPINSAKSAMGGVRNIRSHLSPGQGDTIMGGGSDGSDGLGGVGGVGETSGTGSSNSGGVGGTSASGVDNSNPGGYGWVGDTANTVDRSSPESARSAIDGIRGVLGNVSNNKI